MLTSEGKTRLMYAAGREDSSRLTRDKLKELTYDIARERAKRKDLQSELESIVSMHK